MSDITDFLYIECVRRGINPTKAFNVAESEGGLTEYARRGTFDTGSSWWAFQLHYGGVGPGDADYRYLGTTAGMGNTFTAVTGWSPGNPNAWQDAIRYALDHIKAYGWGAWYGAKAIGIVGFDGVDSSVEWNGTPGEEWDYGQGSGRDSLIVTANDVRFRSGPSVDSPIIRELDANTNVTPLSDHAWRNVKLDDDTEGWIAETYLGVGG